VEAGRCCAPINKIIQCQTWDKTDLIFFSFLFFLSFVIFRATPLAYGGSQARDLIRAVAAGLHHSHSNARSERRLRPIPQFTAMLDLNPLSKARD